jgi:hypothetical protein
MVAFLPWEGAIGPFLLSEHRLHRPPTSWKLECSEQAVSPLEMRLLTVLDHNKSKGGELEIHIPIDQRAVKNAFWNLRSKDAEHIWFIGTTKFRKLPWFQTKPMRDIWSTELSEAWFLRRPLLQESSLLREHPGLNFRLIRTQNLRSAELSKLTFLHIKLLNDHCLTSTVNSSWKLK